MHLINTICVCGAGTMGSGIAQVAAQSGYPVIIYDVNETMFPRSKTSIESSLEKLVEKEKLSAVQKTEVLQRIVYTADIKACIADVVIEAVVEDKTIKKLLFEKLYSNNSDKTIYTTNTSSLSVTALSENEPYATRFAGLHFFNPAQAMKLVEIIYTNQTDKAIVETLGKLVKQFGKTPVVCEDAPGFIVNRVARPYYIEAMQLLEDGTADEQTIDAIMEATGFKMGPFKLMDLIGLDVNYTVSNLVWEALGKPERLRPSLIQKTKVDANELGRKTGKGFFDY